MQTQELIGKSELTKEEVKIVDAIMLSKDNIAHVIPDGSNPDALWNTLGACSKALKAYQNAASIMKLIVGRLLVIVKENPSLWHGKFDGYDDFVVNYVEKVLGVPRSEAYAARRVIEKWPSLTMDEIRQVKFGKLSYLCTITDETQPDSNKWLEAAQAHTLNELKDMAANNGIMPREDSDLASINIVTSLAVKRQWEEFIGRPEIQAYVGSEGPGRILEALMSECEVEWLSRQILSTNKVDGVYGVTN